MIAPIEVRPLLKEQLMKSEIETGHEPSGILVFGIACAAAGLFAALTMATWGFAAYLA